MGFKLAHFEVKLKLGGIPSLALIFVCAAITPLLVAGISSFIPPSWMETAIGLGVVLFVLYSIVVGLLTLLCSGVTQTFGLHQILIFSITALIVTRGKQLLVSTSEMHSIIEAGTLFGACLLVFCVCLFIQRRKQE